MNFALNNIVKTTVVAAVLAAAAAFTLYLLSGTATRIPILDQEGYVVTATMTNVDNLVPASRVRIAGVDIGEVREMNRVDDGVDIVIGIDDESVAPFHEGVTVRLAERSLVGEAFIEIVDGDGEAIPHRSRIPDEDVLQSTRLDDVLRSLDEPARDALGSFIRSLDEGTDGTHEEISATLSGLGNLGREGHTALDAIAAQSEDLRALARDTTTLLDALDTGEGEIVEMVRDLDRVTAATSGQQANLEEALRLLPGVLQSADASTDGLTQIGDALGPVASDLRLAAGPLTSALEELPATTDDLRSMLPALDGVLDTASPTLQRVPGFDRDVRSAIGPAEAMLRDVNPALAYIEPYGPELAAYIANFNAVLQYTDEEGLHYIRLTPVINEKSPQLPFQVDALGTYNNPIPPPGTAGDPGPFEGIYPRVERDPE